MPQRLLEHPHLGRYRIHRTRTSVGKPCAGVIELELSLRCVVQRGLHGRSCRLVLNHRIRLYGGPTVTSRRTRPTTAVPDSLANWDPTGMVVMSAHDVVMLIGDIDLLLRGSLAGDDVVTMVTLPHPVLTPEPPNTIMLAFDDDDEVNATTRTVDGQHLRTANVSTAAVMNGLRPGPTINHMIEALAGREQAAAHTPVFCATRHADGWHVYSRAHQRRDRWCFIRTSTAPFPPALDDLSWLPQAVAGHTQHAGVLNTHQCTVPPSLVGKELEAKFTLPPGTAIWPLAVAVYEQMIAGGIPEMTPRFGQDIEMCDYDNYLFEVTSPTEQRGYVSFMTARPEKFWVKRKQFVADTLIRSESVSSEIEIRQPLASYVRDILRLVATPLPSFRRVRYDIMFESLTTGNHYCLLFDRSHLHDDPSEVLVQCEIEYMRSRRVLPTTETLVLDEFEKVVAWACDFLVRQGFDAEAHYYSKLSFLRDVTRRRLL